MYYERKFPKGFRELFSISHFPLTLSFEFQVISSWLESWRLRPLLI